MAPSELSQDDIDALLSRAAERARKAVGTDTGAASASAPAAAPASAPASASGTLPAAPTVGARGVFGDLMDVPLEVRIRLGQAAMPLEEVASLQEGSVVELDRSSGDPVDVLVNDRLIARGEVVVVDDRFTVRVTEIIAPEGPAG
jgi:flagellar motor switch protein FliN